jgi:hypothetical protein
MGRIARIFMVYSQYSLIGDIRVKDFGEDFGLWESHAGTIDERIMLYFFLVPSISYYVHAIQ